MKIISKFKDYYDSAQSMGYDDKIHYIRETESLEVKNEAFVIKFNIQNSWSNSLSLNKGIRLENNKFTSIHLKVLFYCGVAIPVYQISYIKDSENRYGIDTDEVDYVFDEDSLMEVFKDAKDVKLYQYSKKTFKKVLNDFINEVNMLISSLTNDFIINEHVKYQSPIILYNNRTSKSVTIEKNPILKNIRFFKLKDTFSTFQDITTFLGNTLVDCSTPKMPVGSDLDLIKGKGFDVKYGFRTRPKN